MQIKADNESKNRIDVKNGQRKNRLCPVYPKRRSKNRIACRGKTLTDRLITTKKANSLKLLGFTKPHTNRNYENHPQTETTDKSTINDEFWLHSKQKPTTSLSSMIQRNSLLGHNKELERETYKFTLEENSKNTQAYQISQKFLYIYKIFFRTTHKFCHLVFVIQWTKTKKRIKKTKSGGTEGITRKS